MTLSAHAVIKNEERWIWFALMSVIDYVDEINIIDTGSSDATLEIVNSINSPKIHLSRANVTTPEEFTQLRQRQLSTCKTDWILLLDGDEVWTDTAIQSVLSTIKSESNLGFLINSYLNCIGDVYHAQPSNAGQYKILDYKGHISLRCFRNQPLKFARGYPLEGLFTPSGKLLQESSQPCQFISAPYFHLTHLLRTHLPSSTVMHRQYKYELGQSIKIPFPRVFYLPLPPLVNSPWKSRSFSYTANALWQTPVKHLLRVFSHA